MYPQRKKQLVWFLVLVIVLAMASLVWQMRTTPGQRRFIGQTVRLGEIQKVARQFDANTGRGYPHLMADLIDKGYLPPEAFGLPADWSKPAAETTEHIGRVQKVGDFWFAPLQRPAGSSEVIFGWTKWEGRETWGILFENGEIEVIDGDPSAAFERDAAERARLGLPEYEWN